MGALYQAISKNQNLLDSALESISKMVQEKRRKEALEKYLQEQLNPTYQDVENVYKGNVIQGKDIPTNIQPNVSKVKQLTDVPTPEQEFQSIQSGTFGNEQKVPQRPNLPEGDPALAPITMDEANRQANSKVLELLKNSMTMKDVPVEKQQQGLTLLQQLISNQQTPKKDIGTVNPEYDVIDKTTGEVLREGKPKQQKQSGRDFKVSEDGYYMYWDSVSKDWVKTGEKAPQKSSDQSLAWSKFNYEKGRDAQEDKKEEEKTAKQEKDKQAKYNAIMGSEWVTMDDLIKQGLIDAEKDPAANNYGGAYVVNDKNGNPMLFYDDKQLEDYAQSQISDAPNKWEREQDDSDPLGIR